MIDIFCTRIFSNALKYGFHGEKYISQKKVLLIDTSMEEFYLVQENSSYNSVLLYPCAEGIFLLFQIVIYISGKYFTWTLVFSINGQGKESFLHQSNCRGGIKSLFLKDHDKFGTLGQNPSAKNGLIHFLLGAMLPCSTPFSTSAVQPSLF